MTDRDPLGRRHRFAAEIIALAMRFHFRFPLSLRMVEDMPAARGIFVSHQNVRSWAEKISKGSAPILGLTFPQVLSSFAFALAVLGFCIGGGSGVLRCGAIPAA